MLVVLVDSLGGQVVLNFAESGACRDNDRTDRTNSLATKLSAVCLDFSSCVLNRNYSLFLGI